MAVVDFTLEDIRHVVVKDVRDVVVEDIRSIVVEEVRSIVVEDVRNIVIEDVRNIVVEDVRKVIDERFEIFENKYADDMRAVQDDLTIVIKRLDTVETNSASTRRLVDKHSQDIMQLRTAIER